MEQWEKFDRNATVGVADFPRGLIQDFIAVVVVAEARSEGEAAGDSEDLEDFEVDVGLPLVGSEG